MTNMIDKRIKELIVETLKGVIDKRIKELIEEALEGATVICQQQDNIYGKIELSEWWDSDEEERND